MAALRGGPATEVYQTLVLRDGNPRAKPILVMIRADRELDPGRVARALGERKVRITTQREAERLEVGGISAVAVRQSTSEVLLEEGARRLSAIHVSAGARGVELTLAVADLVVATGVRWVDAAGGSRATVDPAARP